MTREFSRNNKKPLVLIVDDTPANLQLLADMLVQKEYDVRVAPSGELALFIIQKSLPDLILLDIAMPQMDGFEVCRRLKANQHWKSIPVIFISALAEEQDKLRSFAAGGVDYITKPFQSAEVEARVQTHIKLYRYQQHLEQLVQEKVGEIAKALERAANAEKMGMLGLISAGIAHEINQPLNALKMRADSLLYWANQGDTPTMEEIMKDVRCMSEYASQIGEIIRHVRSLVKDEKPNKSELCNMPVVVNNALNLMNSLLERHSIKASVETVGTQIRALIGAVHLEQIVINLLSNSLHALETVERLEKLIYIRIIADDQIVTLEVADNGPGIPAELRARIFDPLYSFNNLHNGMGIGLSIVQKIVRAYDGEIWTADNSMGGNSIMIKLPAVSQQQ